MKRAPDRAGVSTRPISTHVPFSDDRAVDPVVGSPEMREVQELILTPGRKFNLDDLSPALLAEIAERQAIEAERAKKDWPNLGRYFSSNRALIASAVRPRVVFLGDSITENWARADPIFFNSGFVCRGIGGQTTGKLVLRVYPDVVALRPKAIHIMAGSNDIAGNNGPASDDTIVDNIGAMIDIVQANGILVILASIPPAAAYHWSPDARPATRTKIVNRRLRRLASERGAVWVDYHAALTDADGGIPDALANDGVHPTRAGYSVMRPVAERAITAAFG